MANGRWRIAKVGRNCLISEFNVLRGQGGITIGDNVYTAPLVQMLAVDHVYDLLQDSPLSGGLRAR